MAANYRSFQNIKPLKFSIFGKHHKCQRKNGHFPNNLNVQRLYILERPISNNSYLGLFMLRGFLSVLSPVVAIVVTHCHTFVFILLFRLNTPRTLRCCHVGLPDLCATILRLLRLFKAVFDVFCSEVLHSWMSLTTCYTLPCPWMVGRFFHGKTYSSLMAITAKLCSTYKVYVPQARLFNQQDWMLVVVIITSSGSPPRIEFIRIRWRLGLPQ